MERSTAETIVTVYSFLFWIEALILAIAGLGIAIMSSFASTMMGSAFIGSITRTCMGFSPIGGTNFAPFISFFGILVGLFLILLAVFYTIVGQALWYRTGWSRIVAIVLCVLMITSFPLGTIVGIAGIWFFGFQPDVIAVFKRAAPSASRTKRR